MSGGGSILLNQGAWLGQESEQRKAGKEVAHSIGCAGRLGLTPCPDQSMTCLASLAALPHGLRFAFAHSIDLDLA
jgi:hypothetical protein